MEEMNRPEAARLVDIGSAAQLLGVRRSLLYRLVELGRVPNHRIGRYLRFDPAELLAFTARGHAEEEEEADGKK